MSALDLTSSSRTAGHEGQRVERAFLATILVVGILAIVGWAADVERVRALDWPALDLVLRRQAERTVDTSDVAVVLIDDDTLVRLGERWPLRRSTWARLVRAINAYGPKAIAIDAWFEAAEPTTEVDLALDLADRVRDSPLAAEDAGKKLVDDLEAKAASLDGDRLLAQAMADSGRVVVGAGCLAGAAADVAAEVPQGLVTVVLPAPPRLVCGGLSTSIPALGMAARSQAGLDVLRDVDGRARRAPFAFGVAGGRAAYETLSAAAVTLGHADDASLAIATATALDGAAPLLRPIAMRQITTVRAVDLLLAAPGEHSVAAALKGRLVFVGVSARGTEDRVLGALDDVAVPGVYLHANAALDLVGNRHITADAATRRLAVLLGAVLLVALALLGERARRVWVLVAAGVVASLAWSVVFSVGLDAGKLFPLVPVQAALALEVATRLVFRWWRDVRGRRRAQAQRNAVLRELQVKNVELQETIEVLRTTRSAKERMESELQIAHDIQQSLLPHALVQRERGAPIDIEATLKPAREVGGDLYDYFWLNDDRLCVCVGDVSGKGVPSALFMAVARTLLKSFAMANVSPGAAMTLTNDELARNNDSCMFVTVFLAVLSTKTGHLVYSNAGHNPPYVHRADGALDRIAARHGPVIGAVEGISYADSELTLAPGDLLVLYTDGVTEAMDPAHALYGDKRLEGVLRAAAATPVAAVAALLDDVARFQADAAQADDITILAVARHR